MDFRYKLARETFKNKKIPPKRGLGESTVSEDQRGSHSSTEAARDPHLLSLDRETATPRQEKPEKEVSRRGLFDFLRELETPEEKPEGTQKPRAEKPAPENDTDIADSSDSSSPNTEPAPKPGIFRRGWNRIKSVFTKAPAAQPAPDEPTPDEPPPEEAAAPAAASEPPAETRAEDTTTTDGEADEPDPEDEAMSRRNLIRGGFHFFAKPAVKSVQKKIEHVNRTVDKITRRAPLLRPPGAISERRFLQACTRCDACIHACPKDAIKRVPKKMGFLISGTPYIEPIKSPCVMCDDLPCITACPDQALLPVASPAEVNMGYAILDKKKCQAYGDVFCQQCVIDCPIPGAITQTPDGKPVFHKNVCTGCGVCVRSCSTVNIPVAVKIKPQMVIESQLRKKKLEREKAEAERRAAETASTNKNRLSNPNL
ncbi:MAG: 4Fe-4S dicluster domain-containing protein [Nitrospinales bacterium]